MGVSIDEPGIRLFATNLREAIARYEQDPDVSLLDRQKNQLEELVRLENEFRQTLIRHPWGPGVYRAFIHKICDKSENGNILTARPFFRERQEVCTGSISEALEARAEKGLYPFRFNYNFVQFAIKLRKWHPNSKLVQLGKGIERIRSALIVQNMPLAISQARIFWSKSPVKAPSCHLEYRDFMQISGDGLISAVDKFVIPVREDFQTEATFAGAFRKFRPMACQRMVGNFIEEYSKTLIHFFPKDKRKLYRAFKLIHKYSEAVDFEKLANDVNRDAKGKVVPSSHRTTAADLVGLLNAATGIASTDEVSADIDGTLLDRHAASTDCQPDTRYEKAETMHLLRTGIGNLSLLEQKLLRLKGVQA